VGKDTLESARDKPAGSVPTDRKKEKFFQASHAQLIWWNFTRHHGAVIGGVILVVLYLGCLFAEFVVPNDPQRRFAEHANASPQGIQLLDGPKHRMSPFVYSRKVTLDMKTFSKGYEIDKTQKYRVRFFSKGWEYRLWGLFSLDIHLFTVEEPGTLFLMGTDALGRDLFCRIIFASRISLTVGLVGVFLSFVLGCLLGAVSGYFGGVVDNVIQRGIEFIRSIPTIPLWMALSAALPTDWSILKVYFGITLILSLVSWTGLARVVRGKFLELRELDFVTAARIGGASEARVIFRHMLPGFTSYLIVNITLSVPQMILGETALSFLGLGLRPPALSWGVLLKDTQNIQNIVLYPWMLFPALAVVLTVLSFNFLGDGLRDAADPYKSA
jgi:peptide/nickel transport system permease protein